jgi:hypothetical protein
MLLKVGLCCRINGKHLIVLQGSFYVSESYMNKLIVLSEICRHTKLTVVSHQWHTSHGLRSTVLDV